MQKLDMTSVDVSGGELKILRLNNDTKLCDTFVDGVISRLDIIEGTPSTCGLVLHLQGSVAAASLAWPGLREIDHVRMWERTLRRIERFAVPTVCVVDGISTPLALEFMLVTDQRMASRDWTMRLGNYHGMVWPGMYLYRLSRQLGPISTRRFYLNYNEITAQQASELGIVDTIVESSTLAIKLAISTIDERPLRDYAVTRRLMQDTSNLSFNEALSLHLAACDRTLRLSRNNKQ